MKITAIDNERKRVETLFNMLNDSVSKCIDCNGLAGITYEKNHNASKTAILNQITTLRNELLVLAETIKA